MRHSYYHHFTEHPTSLSRFSLEKLWKDSSSRQRIAPFPILCGHATISTPLTHVRQKRRIGERGERKRWVESQQKRRRDNPTLFACVAHREMEHFMLQ